MATLKSQFENLPELELPDGLSERIVAAVNDYRWRKYLLAGIIISSISFFGYAGILTYKLLASDSLNTIESIISGIDFDLDNIFFTASAVLDFIPFFDLIGAGLSLLAGLSLSFAFVIKTNRFSFINRRHLAV